MTAQDNTSVPRLWAGRFEDGDDMAEEKIWTIGMLLKWTERYFKERGLEAARLDAEVLLSHILNEKRIYLYAHFEQPLDKEELARYHDAVYRRAAGEPVAYIRGEKEFMGLALRVSPAVLVPRPETETLVGAVMDLLSGAAGESVVDVGTGSGAIALALAHYLPEIHVTATDISPRALEVARGNAAALGLSERVEFLEGDLLAPLAGRTFDAIVSNPPYIPRGKFHELPREVRVEPPMALDGGIDGLKFYRRFIFESAPYLKSGGFLALEVGEGQADMLETMARDGALGKMERAKDLAGVDRVVIFRKA